MVDRDSPHDEHPSPSDLLVVSLALNTVSSILQVPDLFRELFGGVVKWRLSIFFFKDRTT